MSLADPLTVTISATPYTLPRVDTGERMSEYESSDGLISVTASHSLNGKKRWRRLIRIDHGKVTADPFRPADNVKVELALYLVIDEPPAGYTDAEILAVWAGFNTLLTASSNAVVSKLLGGES